MSTFAASTYSTTQWSVCRDYHWKQCQISTRSAFFCLSSKALKFRYFNFSMEKVTNAFFFIYFKGQLVTITGCTFISGQLFLFLFKKIRVLPGLGIRWSVFWANRSFLRKNERMSDSLKKTSDLLICSFLVSDLSESLMVTHFWWATWAIRSHRSFLVSDLSNSLTSLIKKERMSELLIILNLKNVYKTN